MWIAQSLALFASSALISTVDAAPAASLQSQNVVQRRSSQTEVELAANIQQAAKREPEPEPEPEAVKDKAQSNSVAQTSQIIRGVNIGGWLVLEPWMTPDVVAGTNAVDQWTFDGTSGAASKLQTHWSTYFTQSDVQTIASWGLNAIRIPIGFWAYDNAQTPYIQGADVFLQKAIGWARTSGLKVMIDLHGLPGSQNGAGNSGHQGDVQWQTGNNLQRSISVLKTIATKYGSTAYADVVYAIELANEPIPWGNNNFPVTQNWTQQAFAAIKSVATNSNLQVVMHDAWMSPWQWTNVGSALNKGASISSAPFVIDSHMYQNQDSASAAMNLTQHISSACQWTNTYFLPPTYNLPVVVGEFSAEADFCAYANGTTFPGTTCSQTGCQCTATTPIASWNSTLVQWSRKFVEAQLQAFESSTTGWYMWSYKGPNAWSMQNAVQYGLIGTPVTQRNYPNICSS